AALDNWAYCEPLLRALSLSLENGAVPKERFHERDAHSPLPRAYHWADCSSYVNHVELVRKARGANMPEIFWHDPLIYQGGGDDFLPPRAPISLFDEAWGCDFEAEIAIITDDVPQGINSKDALEHIKLVMLVNDVSLRNLIPDELAKGFGFYQSKPASAFSPVCVTPELLGDKWKNGKLQAVLNVDLDSKAFGRTETHKDMVFDFGQLIAHAAKTRNLRAGTIIGSGTVSNKGEDGGAGLPIDSGGRGYSCIAEQRTVENLLNSNVITPFLKHGQKVRIYVEDENGHSIFGAIEQIVSP
ncbi:MAG: fumarylacetoacetate hydrolase family protein, partial [Caulobacterales bacterium]|nr:fumarylacetoacetate hydrolase family protein [Caulobacterales bacterium]